ncbi:microtubule-associated protein 1B-like [Schistocerca gregaria]|uniref:microtubule-associated protein 1B-like n=1 Tax=Schistocerca gregaria TaxID=7010 RepID=UPI00211E0B84|nr:microtubule-associated protein 1B-like [Schistocerca gregaria]
MHGACIMVTLRSDHQLSSVIILTPSPLTLEGSIGQTLPAESEDRSDSVLSYSWSKMMGKEQTSPEETHEQEQTKSISAQLPIWGSEQDALQEKSVLPGPDEQSDMEAPVAKLSHQTAAEESDLRQQLLKMDEPLVIERTLRPISKEGGVQTSMETVELKEGGVQTSKETVELLSQEKKAKALQKDAGMQTQQKKRDVKPPLKESGVQTKKLQDRIDKELLHERGAHASPPRKRPQKVQKKSEISSPLKKIEEQKTLKDHKPKFQPKKEVVQGAPKKGTNLLPIKQRQGRSLPESSHTQAPLKQTQDQQIPKSDFQESLEDTKTQPVTSCVRTETPWRPNLILVPMQKNQVQTIPEQEETEVFVENYDIQSLPDDGEGHTLQKGKSIQESQQIPEQTQAVKDVESVRAESNSMLVESKSSCTQASMLWLRGLQRLTQQLQAAPKPSEESIAAPQVDAVSEQLKPVQEDIRPKVSFVADVSVSSGSLLSCTVNTMLTASSSSIISEFKRWKHFDSYGGDKDSAKFATTAAEGMDDTRPVVGGASGDSQMIQQEKEFGETSSLASEFHFEEDNAIQQEMQATSEKGEDETSCPEQVPQQKKTRPSVRKSRPKAAPNRRRPGSPLMRGVGETLPTDAATGTLLKQERTPIQRKNIGTQTLKRKHVSRVLTKKRAMHKTIEERLDEEPEEQSEVTEEKTKNVDEESSTEAEQDLVVTPALESGRKSRLLVRRTPAHPKKACLAAW